MIERMEKIPGWGLHGSQFGGVRGKGAVDALVAVWDRVQEVRTVYAVGLFVDIRGAFDNVWWPWLIKCLWELGVRGRLMSVLLSYLSERVMELQVGEFTEVKGAEKGCPQGSVLGPLLLCVSMDKLVRWLVAESFSIAFMDDIFVMIEGNSRRELELRAREVAVTIERWGRLAKMQLSVQKTKLMFLKGCMNLERPPKVDLNGMRVGWVREYTYLGVTIQERMGVRRHVEDILRKGFGRFALLRRLSGAGWGLGFKEMKGLYCGAVESILRYGGEVVGRQVGRRERKMLGAGQRKVLLALCRAYSTVPTAALPVLAGVWPAEKLLKLQTLRYGIRKGKGVSFGGQNLEEDEVEVLGRQWCYDVVEGWVLSEWQSEWSVGELGVRVREFLPDVREVWKRKQWGVTYYMTQGITGHGNCGAYLKRFGKADSDLCRCGAIDTMDHKLFECVERDRKRWLLRNKMGRAGVLWAESKKEWVDEERWRWFGELCKEMLEEEEDGR